jgi:hypothetical protein
MEGSFPTAEDRELRPFDLRGRERQRERQQCSEQKKSPDHRRIISTGPPVT